MKTSPQPNEPVLPVTRYSPLATRHPQKRQTNPSNPLFNPKNADRMLSLLATRDSRQGEALGRSTAQLATPSRSAGLGLLVVILILGMVTSAQADLSVTCSGKRVSLHAGPKEMARILIPAQSDDDPAVDSHPELEHLFGHGRRYRWKVAPQDGLEGEIWVSTFDLCGFVLVGGEFKTTAEKPILLNNLSPCTIEIERADHDRSRFFINSGSQGPSGSLPLTDGQACQTVSDAIAQSKEIISQPHSCSTVCAFRGAGESDCLGIGFVSVRRAEAFFGRQRKENVFTIQPQIAYDGPELSPGQTLRIETLMLNTNPRGGIYCLEEWVDVAAAVIQPRFNHLLMGGYNTWYAYWTPASDHGTEQLWVKGADELVSSGLVHYGVCITSAGVWQNRGAFGEHETWPNLMPSGWKSAVETVRKRGVQICHGGFWGHVSECATVFKEHPEWMVKNKEGQPHMLSKTSWGACDYPFYELDFSIPEALSWFKKVAADDVAEWGTKFYWMDFYGFMAHRGNGAVMNDKTIVWPVEAQRIQLKTIRDALGEGCAIGTYTSPTNQLVGFVDRVRMSVDAGLVAPAAKGLDEAGMKQNLTKRSQGVQPVARNMAAAYFYNQKFWINDPDPIAVGLLDEPETLEEARIRVMICANSGGFPTVGESPAKMAPARLALLKQALPVYGHAARAVDLMDRDVATIHHLHVDHPDGDWEVITLFNWEIEPRTVEVDLNRLGLLGRYHAFEFWTQKYAGLAANQLNFELPPYCCRVIRLTPVVRRPQVIGSDRHVTVGYQELPSVTWDRDKMILTGTALRPQREEGTIDIFVPEGWKHEGAEGLTGVDRQDQIIRARAEFVPEGKNWSIHFEPARSASE